MIDTKRPIELAGMRASLGRAKELETGIAVARKRYDTLHGAIEDQHDTPQSHVGQLENEKSQLDLVLGTMVAGSNGRPNDGNGLYRRADRIRARSARSLTESRLRPPARGIGLVGIWPAAFGRRN